MLKEDAIYRYVFAVGDRAYCCWEYDLPDRNERFLKSLDGGYFNYIANRHLDELEGEHRQRAAVALRAAYFHGLETLFSLLGAMAQAPGAIPAWIPKCLTPTLRHMVIALRTGSPILTQRGRQSITLRDLARTAHAYCWPNDQPAGVTGDRFGRLWERFAHDFLDEDYITEYNSIKHGLRVSAGGFVLRIGEEEQRGVLAPEANMKTIGSSPFGSSYYEPEEVTAGAPSHFRIRHAAVNWRAEAMVQRLQLVAWSINNVVGGLRCLNGAAPESVRFERPEDPDAFESAWRWSVGVHSSNFDVVIDPNIVDRTSRDDLLRELEARASDNPTDDQSA